MILELNVDMGEGFAVEKELLPLIQSCNISCGGHAGTLTDRKELIKLARINQVKIGAHPSYPDPKNFGRVSLNISHKDLITSIKKQLSELMFLLDHPEELHHIKLHGALYNDCATDFVLSEVIVAVIKELAPKTKLFTLPRCALHQVAENNGITVWKEAFLDRGYTDEGKLQPRNLPGALLNNGKEMFQQFTSIALHNKVQTINGNWIPMEAETYCVHGDHPNVLKHINEILFYFNKWQKNEQQP